MTDANNTEEKITLTLGDEPEVQPITQPIAQ